MDPSRSFVKREDYIDNEANKSFRLLHKIKHNPIVSSIIGLCLLFVIQFLTKSEEIQFPYFSLIRFDVSTLEDEPTTPLPTYEIAITFTVRNPYSADVEYNEMDVYVYDEYSLLDRTSLHPFTVRKGFVNVKAKCVVSRPFKRDGVVDFRVQVLAVRKPEKKKKQEVVRFLCNPIRVEFGNSSDGGIVGSMVRSAEADCALDS